MIRNLTITAEKQIKINKKMVHLLVKNLKEELKFQVESLPVNFVGSKTIHDINTNYLQHDYSTDIITFNYSGSNDIIDGEVFISVEDASANAKKYKCAQDEEILRLVIHGILHLVGYDDMDPVDKKKMKKVEDLLVSKNKHIIKETCIICPKN